MKRREFSLATTAALLAGTAGPSVWAQAPAFVPKEGTDYLKLDKPVAVDTAGRIEVIEFFWYSCPHCNAFEPRLEEWGKHLPKDVLLRRVPVAFRDDFEPQQRLFYTLEAMGKLDELHRKVFQAIHAERQELKTEAAITAWAEKQGLNRAKFSEFYQSFSVAGKARRAKQMQDAFRIEGVPSLGVAGRYYTDGTLAQNMERALQVVDHLVGQVRKGR